MRVALRALAALAALAVLALALLAVALPRLVKSEAVRARIEAAARDATGRELRYAELDAGLLPPRLVVEDASLAGPTPEAPPFFEGASLELRLALAPLLARTLVADSVSLRGATLHLVRSASGLDLPGPAPGAAKQGETPAASPPADAAPAEDEAGDALRMAVRRASLRDLRVVLEDRTVEPPVTWEIRELEASARAESLEAPVAFEAGGTLASGGRVRARGEAVIGGEFHADVDVEALSLAPLAPYLVAGQRAAGTVHGTLRATGPTPRPEALRAELRFEGAEIAADELTLRGKLLVTADLTGVLGRPEGRFGVDATDATLRYGDAFEKPAGTPATAEGRIVTDEAGQIGLEDTRVRLRNFEATTRLRTGARLRTRIDAPAFELAGWEALVPALAPTPLSGRLALDGLEVATSPLEIGGALALDGLTVKAPETEPLRLDGRLLGEGARLRGQDLVAGFAGQRFPLELELAELSSTPRFSLGARAEDADSNALMTALAERPDTLSGPLDLDARLAAPLAGERAVADVLEGTVRFSIQPGRMKGVSLLRSAFERMGGAGEAALLAGRLKGGRTLQRFYDDAFEELSGTLRIGGGMARSDDLRLVYDNYKVDLRGSVALADLALDLGGTLQIDEEVDAALAGQETATGSGGRSRVLPLAHVGGTVDAPRVTLTSEAILQFAAAYAVDSERRDKLREKIDERLGTGSGDQVLDALEGLLGGKRQ
jgi:hypothetical protein